MIGGRLKCHDIRFTDLAAHGVEQRESDDREHVIDVVQLAQFFLDLYRDLTGSGYIGAIGQLDHHEKRALIFLGQEAGRRDQRHAEYAAGAESDQHEGNGGEPHQAANTTCIAVPSPSIPPSTRAMMPRRGPVCRRNSAHSAGESVSALIAEITIAALIVTANCRNSVPESPVKAIGTNTGR
jgi:hypothetical protein